MTFDAFYHIRRPERVWPSSETTRRPRRARAPAARAPIQSLTAAVDQIKEHADAYQFFEAGGLPDVTSLFGCCANDETGRSSCGEKLFNDQKGHGGDFLKALAALLARKVTPEPGMLVVLSGGNVDIADYAAAISAE